jgi:hypothetical protein
MSIIVFEIYNLISRLRERLVNHNDEKLTRCNDLLDRCHDLKSAVLRPSSGWLEIYKEVIQECTTNDFVLNDENLFDREGWSLSLTEHLTDHVDWYGLGKTERQKLLYNINDLLLEYKELIPAARNENSTKIQCAFRRHKAVKKLNERRRVENNRLIKLVLYEYGLDHSIPGPASIIKGFIGI